MAAVPTVSEPRLGWWRKVIVFLMACDSRGMLYTLADEICRSVAASEVSSMTTERGR